MDNPTPFVVENNLEEQCAAAKALVAELHPGEVAFVELEPWESRRVVRHCIKTAVEERGWHIRWLSHTHPREVRFELYRAVLPRRNL
jgi:hypothetical protein